MHLLMNIWHLSRSLGNILDGNKISAFRRFTFERRRQDPRQREQGGEEQEEKPVFGGEKTSLVKLKEQVMRRVRRANQEENPKDRDWVQRILCNREQMGRSIPFCNLAASVKMKRRGTFQLRD